MLTSDDRLAESKTQSFSRDEPPEGGPAPHLLVVEDLSSRRIRLPEDGVRIIGRSDKADIKLDSASVSRRHAKLIMCRGEAQIIDLTSHNGTLLNGERIDGAASLSSSDVVSVGESMLVFRAALRSVNRKLSSMAFMRQRLDEEIARADDYDRPFAIATVCFNECRDETALRSAALGALRTMDVVARQGPMLVALLPELEGEAARAAARALLEAIQGLAPASRVGMAGHPKDGCDSDTLLAGSRHAATSSAPGEVVFVSELPVQQLVRERPVVVADAAMIRLYALVRRLAPSDLPVLVLGETGTGKENVAAALHDWSHRRDKPFIAINCAALPDNLVESELFGHERGAFTGAAIAKAGILERAAGGTVFFDELGELSLSAQAKLLRALQERKISRLGDTRERSIDVRIVAATNRQVDDAVRSGRFREDLLFRLKGAVIELPPLRCRREEIPLLARHFVARECALVKREILRIAATTARHLWSYTFPGNVRELENIVKYAVATADGPEIHPWDLPSYVRREESGRIAADDVASAESTHPAPRARSSQSVAEEIRALERNRMIEALEASNGVQRQAAMSIGMPIRTFTFKLKQYGIDAREPRLRR